MVNHFSIKSPRNFPFIRVQIRAFSHLKINCQPFFAVLHFLLQYLQDNFRDEIFVAVNFFVNFCREKCKLCFSLREAVQLIELLIF